jgi:hemerythrin-like metal-binding protein/PAS domain S-box-containing protein
MGDTTTNAAGRRGSALESACVEALVAAELLAVAVVREGLLVHASPGLARMFGPALAAAGDRFAELFDERDRERALRALRASAAGTVGVRARRSDGSRFDVELSVTRVSLADGPASVVALFDITGHGVPRTADRAPASAPAERMSWSPRHEVGIEVIDGQHRHLLELINRLQDSLRRRTDLDELVDRLKELVRYTEHHFATEERLMDEVGASAERHRGEHQRLLEALMGFTARLDETAVGESSHFLQSWLFRHIDEVDRPFGALLRSRGGS